MGKRKTLAPRAAHAPARKTAASKAGTQVAASLPQRRTSSQRPQTRSQQPSNVDNAAPNDEKVAEKNATSSDDGDDTEPVTPNPNRVGTRTTNTNQHPGVLHNIYTAKRRTKSELIEARRIEAEKKAAKAEEAERQAIKHADSMRRVADYEEGLGQMEVDKTPVSQPHPLRRTYALQDIEASTAGNGDEDNDRRQGRDSDVTPEPMEVDFAEQGEDDERDSARFVESDATNQHDEDYVEEEEDDDEESLYLAIEQMKAGYAARAEKRKQHMTKIAEAGDDGDARPTKKAKGSASVDPGGKMEAPANMKVGGNSKKKEKAGVLLRGAVTALRSGAQEQNQDKGGDARGDTRGDTRGDDPPKRYVPFSPPKSHHADTQSTHSLLYEPQPRRYDPKRSRDH
jgi:hypothetical protein